MAVHREASWAEGTGPGATPPGPASRGWQPRRGLSRVPRGAEVDDRLFAAFLCPFSALFSRVQSPCNALASNRGKQQSRETLEPARSAALPMNAGKSHRQPWIPAPTPWFAHFGLFFPVETCNKSSAGPSPTAFLPRGGRRDGEFLAAPFPWVRTSAL